LTRITERYSRIKNDENKTIGITQSLELETFIALSIDLQAKKELTAAKIIKLYFNICFAIFVPDLVGTTKMSIPHQFFI